MKLAIYIILIFSFINLNSQPKNIKVSTEQAFKPEEVTITLDPNNPKRLAAGANRDYFWYSNDGGLTWEESRITSETFSVWGDPCLIFNQFGDILYAHLSNPPAGEWIDRIVVQTSSDNGKSWTDGAGIGLRKHPVRDSYRAQDKEWLEIDRGSSEYSGNIYMSWTEFDKYNSNAPADSSRIRFSYSEDGGSIWSKPIVISDKDGSPKDDDSTMEGAVPAVGPNGEVYIAWAGPDGIVFDKSLDGGKTWGKDKHIVDLVEGWVLDIPGVFRCNGLPITRCDLSDSPHRGTIYINYSDQVDGVDDTDIFIVKSTDNGESWSQPIKVNQDSGRNHQFFNWLTIDPITGYLYVIYYDRRNHQDEHTDVYVSKSTDGGESWEDMKISETPFKPISSVFIGDYIGIEAFNGIVHPIWTHAEGTKLSIWTATYEDEITGIRNNINSDFKLDQNHPNPFTYSTTIPYSLSESGSATIEIYDNIGNLVDSYNFENQSAGDHYFEWKPPTNLSSGKYYYMLKSGDKIRTKSLMLIR